MRKTGKWLIVSGALLLSGWASGEGGVRPALLSLADSPNSLAFGGSFSAVSMTPLDALAYPGLYGLVDRPGLSLGHAALFAGTAADSLGVAYPTLERGTLALGFYRLGTASAEQRDENMNQTGSFSEQQVLARIGYGNFILPKVGLGVNVSYLQRSLGGQSTAVAGLGLGAHYRSSRLGAGLAADNVVSGKLGQTDDSFAPALRANASYALWKNLIMLGLDAAVVPALDFKVGLEYLLGERLTLRLGRNSTVSGLGMGLKLKDYHLDYDMGLHELGSTHQIKMSFLFGASRGGQRVRFAEDNFKDCRRFAEAGQYWKAADAAQRAQRFEALPLDRRSFKGGLDQIVAAGIKDLSGGNASTEMMRRGVLLYLDGKADMARAAFLQAQKSDPYNEMPKQLLAMTMQRDQKPAPPSFVDIDPIRMKLFKTEEYFQKQQWDLALKECREIIAINPHEVVAYVRMGSVYYALGLKDDAVKAWEYAAALDFAHVEVRKALGFMRAEGLGRVKPDSLGGSAGGKQ